MGYTVGKWEGDTLVLDSIGFSDETWLARGGYFHSDQMRVVEKFTRTGNQMVYDVTVEDPEVLVEPWVMPDAEDDGWRHQYDHRRAGKLHGKRVEGSRHADAALSLRNALAAFLGSRSLRVPESANSITGIGLRLLEWIESTPVALWMRESPSVWAFPTVLTLHTAGLAVLVGASWLLDLRLLGISRNTPLSAYRWVFPAIAVGLIVNLLTGVLLFIKNATTWGTAVPFFVKMLLVVVSVVLLLPIRTYTTRRQWRQRGGRRQRSAPRASHRSSRGPRP